MNDFNTLYSRVKVDKFPYQAIEISSVICGIGSCFAEKFLENLAICGVNCSYNPSGIIYNLHSISEIIEYVINNKTFEKSDFLLFNERYISFAHHGSFSDNSLDMAVARCNETIKEFREKLIQAEYFIITPSTSVVYRYIEENKIVANCHKINNNKFNVELLSVDENYQFIRNIIEKLNNFNSKCKIIFTLSPIRHYAGNLLLNSRSKSNLLSAIYQVCEDYSESCTYFPAYEIVHDELRDYRFYSTDLMHLTDFTQEIIFERFLDWSSSKSLKSHLALQKKQIIHQNHRKKY